MHTWTFRSNQKLEDADSTIKRTCFITIYVCVFDKVKLKKALNPDSLKQIKGLEEVTLNDCSENSRKQEEVPLRDMSHYTYNSLKGRLFCAIGKSENTPQMKGCVCSSCPVFIENKLSGYYFRIKGD